MADGSKSISTELRSAVISICFAEYEEMQVGITNGKGKTRMNSEGEVRPDRRRRAEGGAGGGVGVCAPAGLSLVSPRSPLAPEPRGTISTGAATLPDLTQCPSSRCCRTGYALVRFRVLSSTDRQSPAWRRIRTERRRRHSLVEIVSFGRIAVDCGGAQGLVGTGRQDMLLFAA